MTRLEETLASYGAYHLDARNKTTHFVGVPAIVLALFVPLAWLRLDVGGVTLSAAMLLAAAVLVYYLVLDLPLALAAGAVAGLLLYAGTRIAHEPRATAVTWFGILFIGGWILQLAGHRFEERRPALLDNLLQIFVAPIFLCAEVFFALGYKPELRAAVVRRARAIRSDSSRDARPLA